MPEPVEHNLKGADQGHAFPRTERVPVQRREGVAKAVAQFRIGRGIGWFPVERVDPAGPSQGKKRLHLNRRVLLGQRLFLPRCEGLVFQRDPGRAAQGTVGGGELFPQRRHGLGRLHGMEFFQVTPEVPLSLVFWLAAIHCSGGLRTRVSDAVQATLDLASAGGEVKGAVRRMHQSIGERQR